MATWSGTGTQNSALTLVLTVTESSTSTANNTSTLSYTLKMKKKSGYSASYNSNGIYYSVTINGTKVASGKAGWTSITGGQTKTIKSGTVTVAHNADGTKSVACSAKVTTSPFNSSCSGTLTLTTIPRKSSISYSGTTITINKASSSFTHTITYTFGGATGTICTKTTASSVAFTPSDALYNQIPNTTSGTGTLTCTTYSGTTAIGTSTASFTVTVPTSVKPTVSSVNVELDNSSAPDVIKGWGLYVAGYSRAKITASAIGSYKSTISNFIIGGGYSVTLSGKSKEDDSIEYTGGAITSSGDKEFKVAAKDSRGRTSDYVSSGTVTVYPYSSPIAYTLTAGRNESDNKKVTIHARWEFASVNGKNSATVKLEYKTTASTTWTTYDGTITNDTDIELTDEFSTASGYNFRLTVTDALGNSSQSSAYITTMMVLLDFKAGGKGLGIGKVAESDSMEVALDAHFSGLLDIKYNNDVIAKLGDMGTSVLGNESGCNLFIGTGAISIREYTEPFITFEHSGIEINTDINSANDFTTTGTITANDINVLDNLFINSQSVIGVDSNSDIILAQGAQDNSKNTTLKGKNVYLQVGTSSSYNTFRPYITPGDSMTINLNTAGYVTNSKANVCFAVPLSRPTVGVSGVTLSVTNGYMLRQGGSYTHGSSASAYAIPTSQTGYLQGGDHVINVVAVFGTTTNATNNDVIGVQVAGLKITFT